MRHYTCTNFFKLKVPPDNKLLVNMCVELAVLATDVELTSS